MQNSGTNASLRGIDRVNDQVAWASGSGSTVLKTIDGGTHWQRCAKPSRDDLDFRAVQARDADHATGMSSGPGDKSRIYETTDGCRTWNLVFTNPDKDGFFDGMQGDYVVGDPVNGHIALFTTSGKRLAGHAAMQDEALFAASNSSMILVDGKPVIVTGGSTTRFIAEKPVTLPLAGAYSIAHRANVFVVVGGDYKKPDERAATCAYSLDHGAHWKTCTLSGYRSAVAYDQRHNQWIAVGPNGTDVSADNGRTWTSIPGKNWNALSLPFAVGANGQIGRLTSPTPNRRPSSPP